VSSQSVRSILLAPFHADPTAATYPLDLVRARLSIATSNLSLRGSSGAASAFSPEDTKLGIIGMTKKVYRTEGGIRGL
jgi:solute carrier family 25 phosphate transporter 23/24/25/41